MNNIILHKKFLFGIRIFSIICTLFLTIVETTNQAKFPVVQAINNQNYYDIIVSLGNVFVIILCILLSLYPHRLGFLAAASFYYSATCTILEKHNPMGICMFFLGVSVLYIRGEFLINKRRKIVSLIIFYIAITLSRLRFGINVFCNELISQTGYLLVLSIPTFFFITTIQKQKEQEKTTKILNLAKFPGLVEKDVILLKKALENKQYKEIAYEVDRATGTVRNRLNKVYDILGVIDKLGFISTYTGYEIVFQKEDLTSGNKTENNLLFK